MLKFWKIYNLYSKNSKNAENQKGHMKLFLGKKRGVTLSDSIPLKYLLMYEKYMGRGKVGGGLRRSRNWVLILIRSL